MTFCGGQRDALTTAKFEREYTPDAGPSTATAGALPAYVRGLDFAGTFAFVGMSMIRGTHSIGGLPVQLSCVPLRCGVAAVDLRDGSIAGMLQFTSGVTEVFDVRFIPQLFRPMVLNPSCNESKEAFTAPRFSYWIRQAAENFVEPQMHTDEHG